MSSTKFTSTLENGRRIAFGGKENCIEINKYFSKAISKRGLSTGPANTNMITVMCFRATTSKTKKGERADIISIKVEYWNRNLIRPLPRFRKLFYPMDQFMLGNRKMGPGRAQVKLHMSMEASMMVSGSTIRSMEMVNINIWMIQSIMANGRKI